MNKNTVLKLAPNILKRIEYGIDRFYLLDLSSDEIWVGNYASYLFISELDGTKSLKDIINIIKNEFNDYSVGQIYDSIADIAEELVKKGFLIKIC